MNMRELYGYLNQAIDSAEYIEMTWAELWKDGDRLINEFNDRQSAKTKDRWHGCEIYSMFDAAGNLIYTGKSRGRVRFRLLDHRGHGDKFTGGKASSTVGKYLNSNPESRHWKVRIYDLPHSFEEKVIFRHNPYFVDDYKPNKPSVMPSPKPSAELIAEKEAKRQEKLNKKKA